MTEADNPLELRTVTWSEAADRLHALRERVFVEEQGVPREVEWDGEDGKCQHVLALWDGVPVGCARLMPDGKVGRMAVLASHRGLGVGAAMLSRLVTLATEQNYPRLYLHAQEHAAPFYQHAGFTPRGDVFDEAGIPHIGMHLSLADRARGTESEENEMQEQEALEIETTGGFLTGVEYPSPFDKLALQLAHSASRYLYILSPDLDYRVFDQPEMADAIAELARRSRQTEIRLLVRDPKPLVQGGHRLLSLARRMPSKVQLQSLAEHPEWQGETIVIRDRDGVLYKPGDSDHTAFFEPESRSSTQRHLELFQELWRQSVHSVELRNVNL